MNTTTDIKTNNAPRKLGRPRSLPGMHVYVLKPGSELSPTGRTKERWTTAYIPGREWQQLLALTGGDVTAINNALRDAAETLPASQFNASAAARAKALKALQGANAEAVALAAANNAAWEYGDADA